MKKISNFALRVCATALLCAVLTIGTSAHAAETEYTAAKASDVKVHGFYQLGTPIELIGRYNAGVMEADGGSAEIVAYDAQADCMYVVTRIWRGQISPIMFSF